MNELMKNQDNEHVKNNYTETPIKSVGKSSPIC